MIEVVIGHGSAMTRAMLRATLEEADCEVREAATGDALVAACAEHAPDVALVDGALCCAGERPLVERMKADPDLFTVAVVAISDPRSPSEVVRDLDSGVHDVILTPVRDADVVARVRAAARTKGLQDEYLKRGRVMEELVYGDPLTGLFNRRFMFGQLAAAVAAARRHGRALSVCMIDVDHFKALNDELGHAAGDEALVQVARRIGERVRREDFLGRIGGEELLLILPETSGPEAALVAEGVREAVGGRPMILEGVTRAVTVSVGWADWAAGEGPDSLLRRADAAMYRAKELGRDQVAAAERPGRFRRPRAPR